MSSSFPHGCVACLALVLAACGPSPDEMQQLGGPTMGSSWSLKWYGTAGAREVRALVEAELAEVDRVFSRWRDDSEIVRLNAKRSSEPVEVSARMEAALRLALKLAQRTAGAYDPTVGPVTEVYRRARASGQVDEAALAAARRHVGHQRIALDGSMLRKLDPEVQLDLDGIVAGLAADRIAGQLEATGVKSFFLDVTGEILVRGAKPDGTQWRAGIVDPERAEPGSEGAVASLPMGDMALCTSGSYRNHVESGGHSVHHIFDPRTGANAMHRTVSASVLARSAALADGLGTALMVTGPEGAEGLLTGWPGEERLAALLLVAREDGSLQTLRVNWPRVD